MNNNEVDLYRGYLASAASKASQSYDKAVMTFAGGALAISITFLKNLIGPGGVCGIDLVYWSWGFWIGSIILTVSSLYLSRLAMDKAIKQYDAPELDAKKIGGIYTFVIKILNPLAGVALIAGLCLFLFFAYSNIR